MKPLESIVFILILLKKVININSSINLVGKIATIFNIEGKRVMNLKLKDHSIDVSNLSQGSYILRLESEGKVFTQQFIKR